MILQASKTMTRCQSTTRPTSLAETCRCTTKLGMVMNLFVFFYCGEQQVMILDTCAKCDKHMCHTCLDVTGGCCTCHLTDERTVALDSFTPDPQEGKVTTFKKKQKRVVKEWTDLVKRQGQRMQHQHIYLRRWCDSAMPPMISANWVSCRSSTLRGFPFSRHLDHSRSSLVTVGSSQRNAKSPRHNTGLVLFHRSVCRESAITHVRPASSCAFAKAVSLE